MSESAPRPPSQELDAPEQEGNTLQQEGNTLQQEGNTLQQDGNTLQQEESNTLQQDGNTVQEESNKESDTVQEESNKESNTVQEEEEEEEEEEELVYTSEGFEKFLQQAELCGISREAQDELITIFLAEDVSLDAVILHSLTRTFKVVRKYKFSLLLPLLILGLLGFVVVSEYRARKGVEEYQPWQFELSAQLRHWQIKYLSWFDWHIIFDEECFIPNPYFILTNRVEEGDIDCANSPRELTVDTATKYRGVFNNKKFPLPLVLTEAQNGWKLGKDSTLEDLHKVLSSTRQSNYPCAHYMNDAAVSPEFTADPVGALIEGKLTESEGSSPLSVLFLDGCSKASNKLLRGLTVRPIFLDPDIETLGAIKGIVAKGIPKDSNVKITVRPFEEGDKAGTNNLNYIWLAQVLGSSTISLRDLECPENRASTYKMQQGDIVAIGPEDSLEVKITGGPQDTLILYTEFKNRRDAM